MKSQSPKSPKRNDPHDHIPPQPEAPREGFFPASKLARLAALAAEAQRVETAVARAPRVVMSAIRELNELSGLASRVRAGVDGADRLFQGMIAGYRFGGAQGRGAERGRSVARALSRIPGMAGLGRPCEVAVARAVDVLEIAFALDARHGDPKVTRTREAAAFIKGRLRTVAQYEGNLWRREDRGRPGGPGGDPERPGFDGLGGPDGESEPILPPEGLPPGPQPDPPEPDVDPGICEHLGELCMDLYADSVAALAGDPNIDLLATVEPNCLCHDYDANQVFVGHPSPGREFPVPLPPDVRLIFRGTDITANIVAITPQELRFRIPPNSHTGYVYLRGLFPAERAGVQHPERLCGLSMPDFPHVPGIGLQNAPPSLISIIFPPIFDALTGNGQPGPDFIVESCHSVDICWRVRLSDQAANLPIPPCGRIRVVVRDEADHIVHDGGPSDCFRIDGREDQTFTIEATSFAGDLECGRVGPTRITLDRVLRVTLSRDNPPGEELIAGRNGSFFAEISCPAPARGVEVRLTSSDRTAVQVPAHALIPQGQTRARVDFMSTMGRTGRVEIRGQAPGHEDGRLEFELALSAQERCRSLEDATAPWTSADPPRANWSVIDQNETFLGFVPSPRQSKPTTQFEVARAIKQAEAEGKTIRALGSGWSFSEAMLPQSTRIEGLEQVLAAGMRQVALSPNTTEESVNNFAATFRRHFGHAVDTSRLDRNLQSVLPSLLRDGVNPADLFYVEAGMTINFLNTLLNSQTPPVALKTMGGASGQSIAGAISTGTHGGDFDRPPLGDNVRALYLVGQGGVHHWIEPANRLTNPDKLRRVYPCLADHIHYDDDMFRSALVSFGAMGVIYAVVLDVVPQYSLLQWNKWSTWEQLKAEQAPHDFAGLFDGSWSGMNDHLQNHPQIGAHGPNRFAQVVINPFPFDDGSHHCYVTNRVQLPLRAAGGVQPVSGLGMLKSQIIDALHHDITHHLRISVGWDLAHADLEGDDQKVLQTLVRICTEHGYWRGLQIAIEIVMNSNFPLVNAMGPQIDLGFKVMAPGGTDRQFAPLGGTSIEPSFSFFPTLPAADQPGLRVRVPDVITYVNALLEHFDRAIFGIPSWIPFDGHPFSNARQAAAFLGTLQAAASVGVLPYGLLPPKYPPGWISLRVTGRTAALLGMQRFDRTGFVEVSLLGRPHGYELIRQLETIARNQGAALHWGQSCGMMDFLDLESNYGNNRIDRWKAAQQALGGRTFTNRFMERLGLASP